MVYDAAGRPSKEEGYSVELTWTTEFIPPVTFSSHEWRHQKESPGRLVRRSHILMCQTVLVGEFILWKPFDEGATRCLRGSPRLQSGVRGWHISTAVSSMRYPALISLAAGAFILPHRFSRTPKSRFQNPGAAIQSTLIHQPCVMECEQ